MSDGYHIQINTNVGGELVNLRADSGEEMREITEGFAEHSEGIFKNIGNAKQVALAVGVFTGPATPVSASTNRSASGPPGTSDSVPSCPTHGPMKDVRGKRNKNGQPYKNRYYCNTFGCKDSSGQGVWIE